MLILVTISAETITNIEELIGPTNNAKVVYSFLFYKKIESDFLITITINILNIVQILNLFFKKIEKSNF